MLCWFLADGSADVAPSGDKNGRRITVRRSNHRMLEALVILINGSLC